MRPGMHVIICRSKGNSGQSWCNSFNTASSSCKKKKWPWSLHVSRFSAIIWSLQREPEETWTMRGIFRRRAKLEAAGSNNESLTNIKVDGHDITLRLLWVNSMRDAMIGLLWSGVNDDDDESVVAGGSKFKNDWRKVSMNWTINKMDNESKRFKLTTERWFNDWAALHWALLTASNTMVQIDDVVTAARHEKWGA